MVGQANAENVRLTQDFATTGYAAMVAERDPGAITGTRYDMPLDCTEDYQLRTVVDTLLDTENFNYAAQNTAKHKYNNTTMTASWGGGYMLTNANSVMTANTGVLFQTNRMFPLYGATDVWVEITGAFFGAMPSPGVIMDFGAFLASATAPYAPTDGAYWRVTANGIQGVMCYNGVETLTPVMNFMPVFGRYYKSQMLINQTSVEFWIDDVFYAQLDDPIGNGVPFSSGSAPMAVRHSIGATAATGVTQFRMTDYTVSQSGLNVPKLWSEVNAGMGLMAYQGASGFTMGSTAALANSTAPTPAGGSNTTANITGLGGVGAINAAASAATDYIASSYLNPAGATAVTGRTLYVKGVRISAINNGAVVATTPTTLFWYLAFGHTAVSLATAESSNTKAPRRIPLGFMSAVVGAVVGQPYSNELVMQFTSPVVINPGEYLATVCQQTVGTATASQTIYYSVVFDAYYE